jgi:predicted negative regulator of RcsB-dependent stress response
MCCFRNRQNKFKEFFSQEDNLVFCNKIFSVVEALGHQYYQTELVLFTDSSQKLA